MLQNRIMGALTFKKEVYGEVEKDETFTQTAWMIVAVVALLSSIGSEAGLISNGFGGYIIGVIVGTIFKVLGFGVAAFLISWAGKTFFKADSTFNEMVRCLGLAYIWNIIGFLGIFGALIPFLACILAPVQFLAGLAGLVAWAFAAKEALDLEWGPTIVTVLIGAVIQFLVGLLAGAILGAFGLVAAVGTSILTGQ